MKIGNIAARLPRGGAMTPKPIARWNPGLNDRCDIWRCA
jgi:hypothetical protein